MTEKVLTGMLKPQYKFTNKYLLFIHQAEKGQVELREALESTKTALESRIDELLSEKEGAITAVKAGVVASAGPGSKVFGNNFI